MVGIHLLGYRKLGRGRLEREVIPNWRYVSNLIHPLRMLSGRIQRGPEYIPFRTPTPEVDMRPRPKPRPLKKISKKKLQDADE